MKRGAPPKSPGTAPDGKDRQSARTIPGTVYACAQRVLAELGCGFSEEVLQAALAIELRESGLEYLREPHIEIFYRGQSLGLDRPDFVIRSDDGGGVVVEVKQAERTLDEHRQQLLAYLRSLPFNRSAQLAEIGMGLLLRFPKTFYAGPWAETEEPTPHLEVWPRDDSTGTFRLESSLPEAR